MTDVGCGCWRGGGTCAAGAGAGAGANDVAVVLVVKVVMRAIGTVVRAVVARFVAIDEGVSSAKCSRDWQAKQ